jgi:basic membrane protein A and related proteins
MLSERVRWLLATIVVLSLVLSGCGPTAAPEPTTAPQATAAPQPTSPPKETLKVAFVYVAPIGDLGWTWAHDEGRLMLEEKLGDKVETAYIENVPEGPDAERVIRDFAEKGFDLIFTTSFGYMDPTVTVAEEYPETWFVHISGYKTAPNLSTLFGRMYQPRFLSGLVAGKATKTNKIGYVAAFPIPEVIRGINAFTLGVRTANPDATVTVVWTNTWFGPPEEKEAAEALLDQGCDVIAQHQDTTEPQKAAADAAPCQHRLRLRHEPSLSATPSSPAPSGTGAQVHRDRQSIMAGTYATESYWGSMEDGIVDLAPAQPQVPADVAALVDEYRARFWPASGTSSAGPSTARTESSPWLRACMSDEEMLNLDWFVEGVIGEAPSAPPTAAPARRSRSPLSTSLPSATWAGPGPTTRAA